MQRTLMGWAVLAALVSGSTTARAQAMMDTMAAMGINNGLQASMANSIGPAKAAAAAVQRGLSKYDPGVRDLDGPSRASAGGGSKGWATSGSGSSGKGGWATSGWGGHSAGGSGWLTASSSGSHGGGAASNGWATGGNGWSGSASSPQRRR
jgi:hypothetical protein